MESIKHLCSSLLQQFKRRNEKQLRDLKDALLKEATLRSSKLYFEIAVTAYALSKITSKPRLLTREYNGELQRIEKSLGELVDGIGRYDDDGLLRIIKRIEEDMKALERVDRRFFRDVIAKGRTKLAATMYAQGISLGVASEMSGIEKQEVQEYAGSTMMFDRVKEEISIAERIKKARKMLGE
ncbi:hypothetical protein H0O02_01925 [Candidatus Micrarchaeota archaeon]|nr:hypothetical protein [Candidatus Micrarchaeota archaeon]